MYMHDLHEFLEPINKAYIHNDEGYFHNQIGFEIAAYEEVFPSLDEADIVIVGVQEQRGAGEPVSSVEAFEIRKALYKLYLWHSDIKLADIGDIRTGDRLNDSYASVKIVISELLKINKTVVLIGGSHDNTLGQYYAYKDQNKFIEATVIDAKIDLQTESSLRADNFLMEMLTSEPNHIRHYNHIGFQSYFIHPGMLETIDKLRFDCYRVGVAKEDIEEMEPVIRNSSMVSFDIAAIKHSDAPAGCVSPNGFSGEEACVLTRFAGMSEQVSTLSIFGFHAEDDVKHMTATQIAEMIWYFIDGKSRSKQEASIENREDFNEYHLGLTDMTSTFLQSKKTGRWWMELPNKKLIPCSKKDYVLASNNQIPERWLRAQERD
ncbi:MAG: formimidoylglutamase [Ginsengibacter sp.]